MLRNQLGQKRAAHWSIEGAHYTHHHDDGVNQTNGMAAAPGDRPQQSGRNGEAAVAQRDHFAPVEAVRDMSRNQKQEHAGEKLGQADQSEIERPPGDLVHLPSHRHRLHFQGGHDKEARSLVNGEVRIDERDAAGRKTGSYGF